MMSGLSEAATEQGRLWGSSARAWADLQERTVLPAQQRTLEKLDIRPGELLLDIGCGAGGSLPIAAAAGARVHGVDAAEPLLEIARERVPGGDFRLGEILDVPWPDDSFDVVVGFNSFQYAADPFAGLREAKRVLKPGGRLGAVVWGTAEECEAVAHFRAIAALMPPPPPGSPGPLAGEQAIAEWIEAAGFAMTSDERVDCPWHYADLDHALRALMAAGPLSRVIDQVGRTAVVDALTACLAEFRQPDASYLFHNKFRSLTAWG
jgi:SAM-dependent methyltransferase